MFGQFHERTLGWNLLGSGEGEELIKITPSRLQTVTAACTVHSCSLNLRKVTAEDVHLREDTSERMGGEFRNLFAWGRLNKVCLLE